MVRSFLAGSIRAVDREMIWELPVENGEDLSSLDQSLWNPQRKEKMKIPDAISQRSI